MRNHLGKIVALLIGIAIGFGIGNFKQHAEATAAPAGSRPSPESAQPLSAIVDEAAVGLGSKEESHFLDAAYEKPIPDPAGFENYIERHDHSLEAYLAAIHLSSDPVRHIAAAAERFPDDPRIHYLILGHNAFPEDRDKWIERFKKSAPDSAIASIFSARAKFAAGDREAAIEQLELAARQGGLEEFTKGSLMASDAALIEFGFTPLEAKLRGTFRQTALVLGGYQKTFKDLREATKETNDPAEKLELASLGVALSNQFSQGEANTNLINRLVGISGETMFLRDLDPDLESPNFSGTPAELLEQLEAERKEIREFTLTADDDDGQLGVLQNLNEAEMEHYLDRVRSVGELEALRWAEQYTAE